MLTINLGNTYTRRLSESNGMGKQLKPQTNHKFLNCF